MTIEHFENKGMGEPTERLTFESEKEWADFCERINLTIEIREEYMSLHHIPRLLDRLKKKKRMTTTKDGREFPVTFINAEDYHLLTMSFIETLGWWT